MTVRIRKKGGRKRPPRMQRQGEYYPMKNRFSTIILVVILLVGLSLLLYPSVSDYWNKMHQTRAIADYTDAVNNVDKELYEELMQKAVAYNNKLAKKTNVFNVGSAEYEEYLSLLDITGSGMIGYIEIPSIDVSLPIYHGTEEATLQVAVGHLEWSSLPVGGAGTHSVLSGHRGLPSARLFTDLVELEEGDIFIIQVLDQTLTYEVDQIRIVEPSDTAEMMIRPGEDYCTLFTCTPYGLNTHRQLVRGHRIDNLPDAKKVRVTADAIRIEPLLVTPLIAVPILLVLLIILIIRTHTKRREPKTEKLL